MNKSQTNLSDSDVAVILEQLRNEVRTRHAAREADDESHPISHATEQQLQHCAEQLEITRVISAHWPLEHRNPVERGVNIIHRIVRRFLRWYINPIVDQQNGFNDVAARTLRLLIDGYSDLSAQVAEMDTRQEETENQEQPAPGNEQTTGNPQRGAAPPSADTSPPPSTAELQMRVEQRSRDEPPALFPELVLPGCTAQLAAHQQVQAHWPLAGHAGTVFIQKLIRQYLRWLINPIVEQQNIFNAALTASIAPLITADTDVRTMVAALRVKRKRQHQQRTAERENPDKTS